jgi:outer membrane receptor protein involved in Fe transport
VHGFGFATATSLSAALLLAVSAAGATAQALGQAVIHGRIVDGEALAPVVGASVLLRTASDSSVVVATAPDSGGRFMFRRLAPGSYLVEVQHIAYEPLQRAVSIEAGQSLDLGQLTLSSSVIQLDAVAIETERAAAVSAPDRDIYAADAIGAAAGGVATDLLDAIPELEVDIDGSISLRGSSPQIYINGRPAPMDGEALDVFLEQFPADLVERVEVMPNPSARYDADGAGIVNIVLKEGAGLGMSGSLFANAHTRGEAGTGGRITWQRGPLTLFSSGFLRRTDRRSTNYDLRQNLIADPATFLQQDAWSQRDGLSGSADLTAELQLGERTTLRAEGGFSTSGTNSAGSTVTTHLDEFEEWTQRYDRLSRMESSRRSFDGGLRLERELEGRGHELEVDFQVRHGGDTSDRRVETDFELIAEGDPLRPADYTLEDADNSQRRLRLDVDYARPIGDHGAIELGYRGRRDVRENVRLLEQYEDAGSNPIESTLRGFDHRETAHSGYLTLSRQLGRLGAQAGVRLEHRDVLFEEPSGDSFATDGLEWYPSANLSWRPAEGRRVRLSYSRRSRQPSPRHLNPIDRSTDPLNRRVGNPDLEPQHTHSFGLDLTSSTSWGNLRLSPYLRRVVNDWAEIRTVDEDGVATRMWQNVASQTSAGASVRVSVRRDDGWGGFASISGHHESRDAGNLSSVWTGNSFRWSVRTNLSGRLTPSLGVRTNVSWTPPRDVPQGRMGGRVRSSIGVRQQLLDGRASLNLNVNDPLDLSRTSFESRDPTFVQIGNSRESRRSASLSLSYNFGGGGSRDAADRRRR